ncbi:ThuA domain-containing protein [Candidatus Latescibacterota bacterium]
MSVLKKTNAAIIAGTARLAGTLGTLDASAAEMKKQPGETKIVTVVGDYWHNGIAQEYHLRSIFAPLKTWRIIAVRGPEFFTPELIGDADLLIIARYDGNDNMGYSQRGLVDIMERGAPFWTDENVSAIISNVRERGMGFMPLHCTLFCGVKEITDFMDIEPIMHREIQPIWTYNCNREHPITSGIENFFVNLDEQFAAVIKSPDTVTLFNTQAMHDKRTAVGGWCLERGRGRIVGLLPGHTQWPYRTREYQEIIWRAAHWAMKKEIVPYSRRRNG